MRVSLTKVQSYDSGVKNLDMNWARLLVNLFMEEAAFITQIGEGKKVYEVKVGRPLHHGCKISILLLSHLPDHEWSDKTNIPEDKRIPHSSQ